MLGKHTLKPKESTNMTITYRTEGLPGPFTKIATITVCGDNEEEIEVTMTGVVREAPSAKIQVNPRKISVEVQTGMEKRQTIAITNTGTMPLIIKKIYGRESKRIYFEAKPDLVVEPGKSVSKEITIIREKSGPFTELVIIETNARNAPRGGFVIMVTGKARE